MSPAKMNCIQTKIDKKRRQKTHNIFGRRSRAWRHHAVNPCFLSICVSPTRTTFSKRERPPISVLNDVIHLLISDFTCRRNRSQKVRFSAFWGWVVYNSDTAYKEHQIRTQRAWIIGGEVVDMPLVDPIDK